MHVWERANLVLIAVLVFVDTDQLLHPDQVDVVYLDKDLPRLQ